MYTEAVQKKESLHFSIVDSSPSSTSRSQLYKYHPCQQTFFLFILFILFFTTSILLYPSSSRSPAQEMSLHSTVQRWNFKSFYVRVFNLRSYHLRLTLGRAPLCTFTSPGQREVLMLGHPVQYLNNMNHGQNLSSTSGGPEFVVQ